MQPQSNAKDGIKIDVDICIDAGQWPESHALEALCARAVERASRAVPLELPPSAVLTIVFSDDDNVRRLNDKWRNRQEPTNILSFPAPKMDWLPLDKRAPVHLGDLILAFETVSREAEKEAKTLPDHVSHLIVHGFLHICGYDHMTDDDARTMEDLERSILADLGIGDPYA